jgi:hypothetical protein
METDTVADLDRGSKTSEMPSVCPFATRAGEKPAVAGNTIRFAN